MASLHSVAAFRGARTKDSDPVTRTSEIADELVNQRDALDAVGAALVSVVHALLIAGTSRREVLRLFEITCDEFERLAR